MSFQEVERMRHDMTFIRDSATPMTPTLSLWGVACLLPLRPMRPRMAEYAAYCEENEIELPD